MEIPTPWSRNLQIEKEGKKLTSPFCKEILASPLFHSLDLLDFLLLRIPGIGQQEFSKLSFRNIPASLVRILSQKFQSQNLLLQLMLKVQKLFNGQFLILLRTKEVTGQSRVYALKYIRNLLGNALENALKCSTNYIDFW